ncbi:MAG: hypothetical protein HKN36_07810 [Hellea sp.]|nr:hypothetical protein [Hellea sp.]
MRRKIVIAALVSSFALGACGVKGELKTPPPLWGEKPKADSPAPAPDQSQQEQEEPST